MNPELKNSLDALLRTGLCLCWLTGTVLMLTNFVAYEQDPYGPDGTLFAFKAGVCGIIVIAGITAHAYLVDKKVKNG